MNQSHQLGAVHTCILISFLFVVSTAAANAALVSNAFSGTVFSDFNQNQPVTGQSGLGPYEIYNADGQTTTWETTYVGSLYGAGGYGLDENGSWGIDSNLHEGYVGLNAAEGTMTFTFSTPVSAVGGFINYDPDERFSPIVSVYGASGLIEQWDLSQYAPISTPGQSDAGAFRGISRQSAEITTFTVSNNWIVLDDLTFSMVPLTTIPIPPALWLFGSGLLGMIGIARRKPA